MVREFTEEEFRVQSEHLISIVDRVVDISLSAEGHLDANHYFTQILTMVSLLMVEAVGTVAEPTMSQLELMEQNRLLYKDLLATLNRAECPFPDYGEVH